MIRRRVSASTAVNEMKSCLMVEICQPMTIVNYLYYAVFT
jgi:hypothetical protein